jgi:hypothetical protein
MGAPRVLRAERGAANSARAAQQAPGRGQHLDEAFLRFVESTDVGVD